MEAIACIKGRRSVRDFEDTPIPREVMAQIVEAASYAPSWKNTQIARYIVVEDKAAIDMLADHCVMGFAPNAATMKRAAALVLVTMISGRSGFERDGSYSTSKEDRWEMFDAGIATQTFCLAAHDKGIGSVILGIFDEHEVETRFGLPEGQKLAAILAVGYPKGEVTTPPRKPAETLLSYRQG